MRTTRIIDTALDRSIALGYGNLGLAVRRSLPDWPADPPRMDGQVVIVTGAASGLGLAAGQGFAALGATVHAVARSQRRAEQAVAEIRRAVPNADLRPVACDVSSPRELETMAGSFADPGQRLDVLVNNAGVMPDQRARSIDGHELMFATHVLGPFALTALLSEVLRRSAPSRVINVSSGGMYSQSLPTEDFQSEASTYSPTRFYARTKREQVVITELWAERLRGSGVVVHAMHPGWADTQGVRVSLPRFSAITKPIIRTSEQGADTIVWLGAAAEPLQSTGEFWHDRRPRPTHYWLRASRETEPARQQLWKYCQSLLDRDLDPSDPTATPSDV
ncbi:MAG: SDR family NAD(P)-dependent oxidoreductase [Actinomycetota bacterium]|nr:SDR family NAD(P)-dependent oxidoreductase [Actinomycetota bacterium]